MGLPYVQLETDFIKRRAVTIAAKLKVKRQLVVGMASDLFDWMVEETSTDTTPPDGMVLDPDAADILEGVMEWGGEPGKAFAAFVAAGVIEKLEVGARIKGSERYRATWEKNRRRKDRPETGRKPDGNRTVTGGEPALNRTGEEEEDVDEVVKENPLPPLGADGRVLELLPPEPKAPTDVDRVMAHYLADMKAAGLGGKDTPKARKLIATRLKDHPPQELMDAIDGLTWSQYHRDKGYTGLKYAIGDDDRITQNLARLKEATQPRKVRL